jgi:predicted ester cyclase
MLQKAIPEVGLDGLTARGPARTPSNPKEEPMKKRSRIALAAILLTSASAASAQSLSEAQARAVIAPWYSLFNVASRGDVKSIQEQVTAADYESCSGYLPGECWGRDTSVKVVANFAKSIPDMTFDIKEVLVAGDRVVVRGEVSGTPAGELFGVPHTGKSFRIMAVDIHTIRDGKIAKTYHLENWASALGQLRAK